MQLFFNPHIRPDHKNFLFDKEESRHIVRVLRKRAGDRLYITNGKGFLFECEILDANDKRCTVSILSTEEQVKPHDYHLHIAIAPTKNNDRLKWFLEKATEIGIDSITPILCDNSERKIIKPERFLKVIISALKQSLRTHLPELQPMIRVKDFITQNHNDIKLIAHCEKTDRKILKELVEPKDRVLVLIGPEGDFSPEEIKLALQNGFAPLSLGKSRLRTETAGVVVCSDMACINA